MVSHLPRRGRILDSGCGHGLLSLTAALSGPDREIQAIDHDEARVALAREAVARAKARISVQVGSILSPPEGQFDAITLIDVMHYFTPELQSRILQVAFERLRPGGRVLIREIDPRGGPASVLNRIYEKIATTIGFTKSSEEKLYLRLPEEWTRLMESHGFRVRSERCSSRLFADVLFICEKPLAGKEGTA
jgi:2-polyprenyl-3-methyl-5-hydroxy-6-metoxy-1,4-benzoquinol methylase